MAKNNIDEREKCVNYCIWRIMQIIERNPTAEIGTAKNEIRVILRILRKKILQQKNEKEK